LGAHNAKTGIIVPVVGIVVVAKSARQILRGIVPSAATQSARIYSGSSPLGH
jgi:hypothetical protein